LIHYALGRWTPLIRYCDDGALEIDNNTALCRLPDYAARGFFDSAGVLEILNNAA
jgi:hypothetical protein